MNRRQPRPEARLVLVVLACLSVVEFVLGYQVSFGMAIGAVIGPLAGIGLGFVLVYAVERNSSRH